ncbi:MAG: glycine cleavage system protein GcvH [Phycisphaerales bacterium]|nr:glycine cleavage system protein GcvH [Phycisphaerales bacterium]
MPSPDDCRYSDSHEWFRIDGDVVTLGITPHAAAELTDVTYVEMRPVGTAVQAGDAVAEVESVKTTSDVFSAVGGEIIEINDTASEDPAILNRDPQGDGWLVRIRTSDMTPLETLMDAAGYDERYTN